MRITRTILLAITLLAVATMTMPFRYMSRQQQQLKQYQIRRPLQYFFYLLQLKSSFNPMLGAVFNMGNDCSSKAGPFCTLTGHQPFQTHSIRRSELTDQQKNIYDAASSQAKSNYQLYDSLVRNQDTRFLIRNDLTNELDRIMKQKIGDRMHMANILPPQYFQEVK